VPEPGAATLVELLRRRAREQPDALAVTFLLDGERDELRCDHADLDRRACRVAAQMQEVGVEPGERVLLMYPPGIDYVAAFFGCLYAGAIAVPAYPPLLNRPGSQLASIVADAMPALALTTVDLAGLGEQLVAQEPALGTLRWLPTDAVEAGAEEDWRSPALVSETIAFLQYTSGSTATPKGVVLSHGNLLANTTAMCARVGLGPDSRTVSWLPPYHDAGLIGKILTPLVGGFPTVLMSPIAFLQRPARWLEAIDRHRATCSAAPNFAYELCVRKTTPEQRAEVDLSCWERAMNTGEPVRAQTLRRFAEAFAPAGFHFSSFYPCYGLAESTLMVGGPDPASEPRVVALDRAALQANKVVAASERCDVHELVACGRHLPGHRVVVADVQTREPLDERRVGEIWVHGPSVAQGYWQAHTATQETFRAQLAGDPTAFLRTGDLGFLDDGDIYVTGRAKDMVVVRGRNHYAQDVECTAEQADAALRPGCGAAFAVERDGEERLVLVNEVDRARLGDADSVLRSVRGAILRRHGVRLDAIVLIERGALPKTSSGKQRRRLTRERLLRDELPVVAAWQAPRARRAATLRKPAHRRKTIVLTGASGVVGKALLPELTDHELICLVNRGTLDGGRAVVRADVTEPLLGLERADYEQLVRRADCVIHAAAITDWAAPAERIRMTNVEGTASVLELARAAGAPLYYLSTAFVAAIRPDAPIDLPAGHIILDYVTSKRDAEQLVRASGLPVTVLRPTNLIGDSTTGQIARNQIIQQVIGFVCRGKVPLYPTRRETLADVLPQDVLAKAVAGLVRDGEVGGDYWLTYGERAFTVPRALELCVEFMHDIGRPIEPPRIVDPDALDADRDAIEALTPTAKTFFRRLLEFSEGMTACGVFPSDLEALGERYDLGCPSLEDAYRRGLRHWVRAKGIDRGSGPMEKPRRPARPPRRAGSARPA
jgi:acyl-CoA synthetase (AMP-forming)/AMP-acid ligase II/nucleoside-diphosphate-sugar epimerase